jgi:ubiquinone/menaquinone biosynthesis C-methylase UbiE
MGFYDTHILPQLIALAMKQLDLAAYRARIVPAARGRVLDVGIGSGLNLPFYGPTVEQIFGLDPSSKLLQMARRAGDASGHDLRLIEGSAEAIPLEAKSIDTAVVTFTLCSVKNLLAAMSEIRRVLKPGGELLFVEHGLAPDQKVAAWQRRLTPLWKRFAGGCHLDRDVPSSLSKSGFEIVKMQRGYMRGPRVLTFISEGSAHPT